MLVSGRVSFLKSSLSIQFPVLSQQSYKYNASYPECKRQDQDGMNIKFQANGKSQRKSNVPGSIQLTGTLWGALVVVSQNLELATSGPVISTLPGKWKQQNGERERERSIYGCWTKNSGEKYPKMDGENNGKPY